jgi:hypothetical protein
MALRNDKKAADVKKRALTDVIGKRGENIVELCLTEYSNFPAPLFDLTHLGDKWPVVGYYVELTTVGRRHESKEELGNFHEPGRHRRSLGDSGSDLHARHP